jgi:hypothetical protein
MKTAAVVLHVGVVEVRGPSGRTFLLATPPCITESFARDLAARVLPLIDGRARVISVDVLPEMAVPGGALVVKL